MVPKNTGVVGSIGRIDDMEKEKKRKGWKKVGRRETIKYLRRGYYNTKWENRKA